MDFLTVNISCSELQRDLLIAELDVLGFSAIQELPEGLTASLEGESFDEPALKEAIARYEAMGAMSYTVEKVAKTNWNEAWEKNFDPVIVDDRVLVRAPFHDIKGDFDHEILIMPKMSFGTGHHATTSQMLSLQLDVDFKDKSVLDVGTGTGVLAIMALKLGASHVEATDIDDWCIENSLDNLSLNGFEGIRVEQGEIKNLTFDQTFDIVIANINKNVLLAEIDNYVSLMNDEGQLFLSGFYEKDIPDLEQAASKLGLKLIKSVSKDDWSALLFNRIGD
ncbi:MAG: 50S ribosomal protein L11 methyltransferase [Cytophagales bacterium]|nr:50S ribosomal protein L11 methyltransferase [Cytophagales bacterium]